MSAHPDPVYPDLAHLTPEQRELHRLAGVSALRSRNAKDMTADAKAWAEKMAALPALGQALTTGEPA